MRPYTLLLLAFTLFGVAIAIPVNMMMPLDTIVGDGLGSNKIRDVGYTKDALQRIKASGFDGVMLDVWWGLTEQSPKKYSFAGYLNFVELAANANLKVQLVTSFHQCGGNVNDPITIPIPDWVRRIAGPADAFYKDGFGNQDSEYISLAASDDAIFEGRSAYEMYHDWIFALFNGDLRDFFNNGVIEEIQVGAGPAGELRYPSYQLARWSYPHPGAFQTYDYRFQQRIRDEFVRRGGASIGKYSPSPSLTGGYNVEFEGSGFFRTNGAYLTSYGQMYADIIGDLLVEHGTKMMDVAINARTSSHFRTDGPNIAFKVAGIHWGFNHPSHGAEMTAGYKNDWGHTPVYNRLAKMASQKHVTFDFTCFEMTGTNNDGYSNPEQLVKQVVEANSDEGAAMAAENALSIKIGGDNGVNQIVNNVRHRQGTVRAFTVLRYNDYYPNDAEGLVESLVRKLHDC